MRSLLEAAGRYFTVTMAVNSQDSVLNCASIVHLTLCSSRVFFHTVNSQDINVNRASIGYYCVFSCFQLVQDRAVS